MTRIRDFDAYVDAAANELEAAGHAYTPEINPWLAAMFQKGVPPHRIVAEYQSAAPTND